MAGLTRNISSSGVLFTTEREPDLSGPIEYVINLSNDGNPGVNLRCIGKVIRAERLQTDAGMVPAYQVAATLERYEFIRD
jgi:hypothetical protein